MVDTESYDSWLAFLRAIRSRGAAGVRLVVSDARPGLVRALGEVFQGAAWQRCAVHLMRDCMREAGSWQLRRRVGRIVSQVFRGRDAATVTAMYHAACDMLEGCCPRAAAVLEKAEPDALAYLNFPPSHWKRPRTNNVQERTNRKIKRRSRVVQAFASTASLVRLAGAAMCKQDEMWQESRYFSEAKMGELHDEGRTRGVDRTVDWARLEAAAREMLEPASSLLTGSRRHRISTVFQIPGCRADSLRIGRYTNFLDTTSRRNERSNSNKRYISENFVPFTNTSWQESPR